MNTPLQTRASLAGRLPDRLVNAPLAVALSVLGFGLAGVPSGAAQVQAAWQKATDTGAPSMVHHDMTYDSARHALIVACRTGFEPPGAPARVFLGQADGTWTALPSVTLPDGSDIEIAYDSDRHVTVLYAAGESGAAERRVWELSGTTWNVIEAAAAPVQCLDGAMLQYDPVRKKTVLVGCNGYPEEGQASETWLWDGANWTLAADTSHSPSGAVGGSMVFDAARGEMVLLTHSTMETWTFDGSTWTQRTPATAPSPGVWCSDMAFHPPTQQVVTFGGEHLVPSDPFNPTYPVDVWAWNGTNWQLLESSNPPPDTIDFGFAWFPERSAVVMHGGWGPTQEWDQRSDVWLLTLASEPAGSIRIVDIKVHPDGTVSVTTEGQAHSGKVQVLQGTRALGPAATWSDLLTNAAPADTNLWNMPTPESPHFFRILKMP